MNAHRTVPMATLLALALAAPSPAHAAWARAGNPVCVAPGAQHDPVTATPFVAWTDERDGVPQVYLTSIDPWQGTTSSFPLNGLRIAPSAFAQDQVAIAASSWDGSVFIAWSEDR